jgi:hypothetical protein
MHTTTELDSHEQRRHATSPDHNFSSKNAGANRAKYADNAEKLPVTSNTKSSLP